MDSTNIAIGAGALNLEWGDLRRADDDEKCRILWCKIETTEVKVAKGISYV